MDSDSEVEETRWRPPPFNLNDYLSQKGSVGTGFALDRFDFSQGLRDRSRSPLKRSAEKTTLFEDWVGKSFLFKGKFFLTVKAVDLEDVQRATSYARAVVSVLGGQPGALQVDPEKATQVLRLTKVLSMFDGGTVHERENAGRLLKDRLGRLNLDFAELRKVHDSLDGGADKDANTLAIVQFENNLVNPRKWFEDLARAISGPLGLAQGREVGPRGIDGVSLCGPLAAALTGAMVLARVASAAVASCMYKDVDAYCGAFALTVVKGLQDEPPSDAAKTLLCKTQRWLVTIWEYNTPSFEVAREYRRDTPTAARGSSAAARRQHEFAGTFQMYEQARPRALCA